MLVLSCFTCFKTWFMLHVFEFHKFVEVTSLLCWSHVPWKKITKHKNAFLSPKNGWFPPLDPPWLLGYSGMGLLPLWVKYGEMGPHCPWMMSQVLDGSTPCLKALSCWPGHGGGNEGRDGAADTNLGILTHDSDGANNMTSWDLSGGNDDTYCDFWWFYLKWVRGSLNMVHASFFLICGSISRPP